MTLVLGVFINYMVYASEGDCFSSESTIDAVHAVYKRELNKHKPIDILGLWDIDLVLLQSSHPAFQKQSIDKHKKILKELFKDLSEEEVVVSLNISSKKYAPVLIEKDTPKILRSLQNTGVLMLGLTGSLTGEIPGFADPAYNKYMLLKSLGYDFSYKNEVKDFYFNGIPSYRNSHPTLRYGIISSNGTYKESNKGETLVEYLSLSHTLPKVIIFTDDLKHNLKDVKERLAETFPEIEFIGIHYTAATDKSSDNDVSAHEFKSEWLKILSEIK